MSHAWRFSSSIMGTKFHIEHIADDEPENPQPYWHVQHIILFEADVAVARGIGRNFGLDARLPARLVRDRVHYQDLARRPYTPPNPGLHHRNETVAGLGDPQLGLTYGRQGAVWGLAARVGLSIPLGRTEANPFELGSLGLWHQHIQLGTGTWDPILGLAVGRPAGSLDLQLSGTARLPGGQNEHGYRAGRRYSAGLSAAPYLGTVWSASAGLTLAREEAEKWNGHIETEGNIGRTDLFLSLGAGRAIAPLGRLSLGLELPLASKSTGHQMHIPVVLSLSWSR